MERSAGPDGARAPPESRRDEITRRKKVSAGKLSRRELPPRVSSRGTGNPIAGPD